MNFCDSRVLGEIRIIDNWQNLSIVKAMGPELLKIQQDEFIKLFQGKKTKIKPLLMDQNFLAGVGNIYAQEALFCAGVHPERSSANFVLTHPEGNSPVMACQTEPGDTCRLANLCLKCRAVICSIERPAACLPEWLCLSFSMWCVTKSADRLFNSRLNKTCTRNREVMFTVDDTLFGIHSYTHQNKDGTNYSRSQSYFYHF